MPLTEELVLGDAVLITQNFIVTERWLQKWNENKYDPYVNHFDAMMYLSISKIADSRTILFR